MENKPATLYRGIKIDYNRLQDFQFSGVDLVVNYAPIIDQYGRKTVGDGNEYGVYMSDNLQLVEEVYGNLHHDGIPVHDNLAICHERVMIPSVAVIYKINTEGLDIRRPFITRYLTGHYNNGYQGDEWIADAVPAHNYELYRVRIGADILHDVEDIQLARVENLEETVKQKLEARKARLETFVDAIERLPLTKRNDIDRDKLNILKSIYGANGLKYINEDYLVTSNVDGMLRYLAAKTFKQNELYIDFQTIKYINSLRGQATNIDSIIEILKNDKIKNMQEKVEYEERRKQEGKSYVTSKFDKQEKMLDNLMTMIFLRQRKDNKQMWEQDDDTVSSKMTGEEQAWKKIQEKYDYNGSDFNRRRIIEQQFREMFPDKKDAEIGIDDLFKEDLGKENLKEKVEHTGRKIL